MDKKLKEIKKIVCEQSETTNREMEIVKRKQILELKNTLTGIKNLLERFVLFF